MHVDKTNSDLDKEAQRKLDIKTRNLKAAAMIKESFGPFQLAKWLGELLNIVCHIYALESTISSSKCVQF